MDKNSLNNIILKYLTLMVGAYLGVTAPVQVAEQMTQVDVTHLARLEDELQEATEENRLHKGTISALQDQVEEEQAARALAEHLISSLVTPWERNSEKVRREARDLLGITGPEEARATRLYTQIFTQSM